jgi:soluble lytic murein transglycosylase-like protein
MRAASLVLVPFWALFVQYGGDSAPQLAAQARQESGFNPSARSPAGAMGLTQFMPGTWRDAIRRGWVPAGASPWDVPASIQAQAAYMGTLRARFRGDWAKALVGYNAGEGNVDRAVRVIRGRGIVDTPERRAWLEIGLPSVTGRHSAESQGYVHRIETVHLPWVLRRM